MDTIDFSRIKVSRVVDEPSPKQPAQPKQPAPTVSSIPIPDPQPAQLPVSDVPTMPTNTTHNTTLDTQSTPSAERTTRLTKLRLFFSVFPKKLKQLEPKDLDALDDGELADLHRQVDFILGAKSSVDGMAAVFPAMVKGIEDLLVQFTPLRIQGTHMVCLQPDVQDTIKYAIIDSGVGCATTTPVQRLAFTLLSAAAQRHVYNTSNEAKPVVKEGPPNPKFADL